MTDDPDLDAGGLAVTVEHRVVTLTGAVDGRERKRYAEDLGWAVRGVTDVMNQIEAAGGEPEIAPTGYERPMPEPEELGRGADAAAGDARGDPRRHAGVTRRPRRR